MNSLHLGESRSIWSETEMLPRFPALRADIDVDVCVIGGGIAGLTTAYLLLKEGKRVCLLEDFELGSGQTSKTTAHFTAVLDKRFYEIERNFGLNKGRSIVQSHRMAIQKVEDIVQLENIDCDLQRISGYLFGFKDQNSQTLKRELRAALNLEMDVELRITAPLMSYETGPCLRFSNQMKLHPLKYLAGLVRSIIEQGGLIFSNSHVNEVKGGADAYVKTQENHRVSCQSIVVATNSPINNIVAIHTKQAPYRSYVVGFKIPKNSAENSLYWDIQEPYHYVRVVEGDEEDILIVGGADHKTGQADYPETHYKKLEEWARERFVGLKKLTYTWSGQVMEPVDGIAYLGHNPMDNKNVYVITGTSGNGMTYGTIGAMLICDQIMGRENPWEKIYSPGRITLSSIPEFIKENSNVAAQYADWFSGSSIDNVEDLAYGEGMVFRKGLKQVAVYKDQDGSLETYSAACPHLGGVVTWNSAEQSWDCPCHGSRFDCHGRVIEGPAITNLKPVFEDEYLEKIDIERQIPQPL